MPEMTDERSTQRDSGHMSIAQRRDVAHVFVSRRLGAVVALCRAWQHQIVVDQLLIFYLVI